MSRHTALLATAFGVLAATVSLQPAAAQTVSASVTGLTGVGVAGPVTTTTALSEVRNDGVQHSEASATGGSRLIEPRGTTGAFTDTNAFAKGFASADPGVLRVFAQVEADVVNGIIGPQLPPVINPNFVSTRVVASASFSDFLNVKSTSLANGAAIDVPFVILEEFVTHDALFQSSDAVAASGVFTIGGLQENFFTSGLSFFQRTDLGNGDNFYQLLSLPVFHTHVGDDIFIRATLTAAGIADNNAFSGAGANVGNFLDGRNTAAIFLGDLPSGLSLTSASGHDYTIDPRAVLGPPGVPEPQTYALLIAGFGLLGSVLRRRRRSEASAACARPNINIEVGDERWSRVRI